MRKSATLKSVLTSISNIILSQEKSSVDIAVPPLSDKPDRIKSVGHVKSTESLPSNARLKQLVKKVWKPPSAA